MKQISKLQYTRQDRQYTCNVTMGRVRVAVNKQQLLNIISVCPNVLAMRQANRIIGAPY
jgi:hypothetical protein